MNEKKTVLLIEPNNNFYTESSLEKPLGGSETVFLFLCRALKKNPNVELSIRFKEDDIPSESFDLVIAYRSPEVLFNTNGKVQAVFFQDLPSPQTIQFLQILRQKGKIHRYIFLSHFQKGQYLPHLQGVEESRQCLMTENGIDVSLFADETPPKENYFLYASAPNRGLDVLLKMWPKIHEQLPDYTLRIAGSTTMYNVDSNTEEENKSREEFLGVDADLYELAINLPGVELLGGLKHSDLISMMEEAKALLYPSTFPETCCHVLNNALHAGASPIVSQVGCLVEKVSNGENGFVIPGDPTSQQFQDQYVQTVVQAVKSGTLDRMAETNRRSYTGLGYEKQVYRLVNRLLFTAEYEGENHKILGVCCSLQGNNHKNFANLRWYAPYDMQSEEVTGMPTDQARNVAASLAIHKGADWLLLLDDDIYVHPTFLMEMLRRALATGAKVVVANYFYKDDNFLVPVTRIVNSGTNFAVDCTNLREEQVNAANKYYRFVTSGLGACLISTEALKMIGRPQFRTQAVGPNQIKHTGEDSYFFEMCAILKIPIYVALDIPVAHMGNGKIYGKPDHIRSIVPTLL